MIPRSASISICKECCELLSVAVSLTMRPLPLIALFLSPFSSASTPPSSAVIDSRYGTLLDNSPQLKADGRISSRGFSMLCGPAAFENALTKIRTVKNLPAVDPIQDLEAMVPPSSPIIENGIQPDDLKALIEQKLNSMGVSAVVQVDNVGPNTPIQELAKTVDSNTIVLMSFVWWPIGQFVASRPWTVPYEMGHWITASGYDLNNASLFYFQDTLQPNTVAATLSPAYPGITSSGAAYENQLVQYEWSAPYPANTIPLMGSLIKITF